MRSFTIIETLITIVVLGLIIGVVFGMIVKLYKTQTFTWQQSTAIEEARRGIKIMVREIREARPGDDGSYPIEKADNKEIIFYSDIDKDGETEKVRYFLGAVSSETQIQECVTFSDGGSCSVVFSGFLQGDLVSAQVKVSVEGDFGWSLENAEVYADGNYLDRVCRTGCSDCAGLWQGDMTFDVTSQAADNYIEFLADANYRVNNFCDWQEPNHAMKARFEFSFEQDVPELAHQFKKGITDPTTDPIEYPENQEQLSIISYYVRNEPPIFSYFDKDNNEIIELPARLIDTKLMKVYLVINVNPIRAPDDFELESYVQLRNLKDEY